jgi:NAD-dependent dihydropyrimidine dehydrogenase PreA subunit
MKNLFLNNHPSKTQFIQFNSKNCHACWKCIDNCPNYVLGKINILGHRHARIENPGDCTGCFTCVDMCEFNALSKITSTTKKNQTSIKVEKEKFNKRAFVSGAMLISGLLLPLSGIMNHNLQFELFTSQRHFWMAVHNMSASLFTIFAILHLILNRRALKTYIVKEAVPRRETLLAFAFIIFIVALFSSHAFHVR